jgi:hypothetical protein
MKILHTGALALFLFVPAAKAAPGRYVMRVTLEDQPTRQFDFDVR